MKEHFPLLRRQKKVIYLDSASTTQKPSCVMKAVTTAMVNDYANVHRGLYPLAINASEQYESARETVAKFINADANEIIFTKGTTEGLNALAAMLPELLAKGKNEILLTEMEHHANIVPWQQLAKKCGFKITYIPIKKNFELNYTAAKKLITKKTAIVSVVHISNTLGTLNDVEKLCKFAKKQGAYSIVDGAQSVSHMKVDVKKIDCDFFVFSGHKLYGPTGVGVLFGRHELLEKITPYQTGGNMIESVTKEDAKWADVPHRFEAGTTPFVQAMGLAAAIDFVSEQKLNIIKKHISQLTNYALKKLQKVDGFKQIGPNDANGIISFTIKGVHPHDIADELGQKNICVRGGHHCTMPLHKVLGIVGTTRMSFGMYNTKDDVDTFVEELVHIVEVYK